MTLYPLDLSQLELAGGGFAAHNVIKRARVEITRI